MLLTKCIFSMSTYGQFCLIYIKNKVTKFCRYVLKLQSLFEKPSNWSFRYLMTH